MERDETVHAALEAAAYRITRPVARICLRLGLAMGRLRAAMDLAIAHEAANHLNASGKKPTVRSLARVAGLPRRRASELQHSESPITPPSLAVQACAARIASRWEATMDRTDTASVPAAFTIAGGTHCVANLVRKHAEGIDKDLVVRELLASGLLEVVERDVMHAPLRVRITNLATPPEYAIAAAIEDLGNVCGDAAEMIDMSLQAHGAAERTSLYRVTAVVHAPQLRVIRRKLRERGEALITSLDEALEPHDVGPAESWSAIDEDPESLHSVRVTFFTAIRRALRPAPTAAPRVDARTST